MEKNYDSLAPWNPSFVFDRTMCQTDWTLILLQIFTRNNKTEKMGVGGERQMSNELIRHQLRGRGGWMDGGKEEK